MERTWAACFGAAVIFAAAPALGQNCEEGNDFPSTFAAIQKVIFENRGCTESVCHGAPASTGNGFLDLRPEVAYQNLVSQPSQTVPGWFRVFPGQRDRSLLFINVAAKTLPDEYTAPLRPMPLDPVPAISTDELEALRKWVETGASREGIVPGTDELLDACLPPPLPIEIEPLPPPAPSEGVQLHMPRWVLEPESEDEVCYTTYYDLTDQVPAQFRGPNGDTVRYKRAETRQDPLSHHLIVNLYTGQSEVTDPVWGSFKCRGGAADGQTCDPTESGACGAGSGCATDPATSIACFGANNLPDDAVTGIANNGFVGSQETASTIAFAPGVYSEIPLKGMIIWNSHAFNLTAATGKVEAWVNLYFAPPEEQVHAVQQIFEANPPILFKMTVAAFEAEEVCQVFPLPPHAQLFELSSHMHGRGKRWRTFEGAWQCQGGPNDGDACSPFGPDEAFEAPDLCAGAPCSSRLPPKQGDCNEDLQVSIDELVKGVNIALDHAPLADCPRFDMNDTGLVTIAQLIAAVSSSFQPALRDPQGSLLYTNFIYNDPIVLALEPPMSMAGFQSMSEERALTYCALYDNGFSDPSEVKRKSTSPAPPLGLPLGGPCATPTGCTEGRIGAPCSGATQAARDASCDTTDGAGDGFCDACTLIGGVTTEDEMFLLIGNFFVNR
jgi:hypothetical protein